MRITWRTTTSSAPDSLTSASAKRRRIYFHLLKYGPKTPALPAKSLKTYREDIHRTLTSLIDNHMVYPSLDSPTVYTAVDLDRVLRLALEKRESELREMEQQRQELQEILAQQQFGPSDEFTNFSTFKSVKEVIPLMMSGVTSLEKELLYILPRPALVIMSRFGVQEAAKKIIERGGRIRSICDVTYPIIEHVQELLDMGQDVRHFNQYQGIYFGVMDRKYCVNAINADIKRMSLDEPVLGFYTNDAVYVNSLIYTFEVLWEQAVPAAQRIEELLNEGPPQV